jgi:hypothetical protein
MSEQEKLLRDTIHSLECLDGPEPEITKLINILIGVQSVVADIVDENLGYSEIDLDELNIKYVNKKKKGIYS